MQGRFCQQPVCILYVFIFAVIYGFIPGKYQCFIVTDLHFKAKLSYFLSVDVKEGNPVSQNVCFFFVFYRDKMNDIFNQLFFIK